MADTVTALAYFAVVVPNKTGEGAKVLSALNEAGVNMIGFWGYPVKGKKAQLDIAPADAKVFAKAAKKLGLEVAPKRTAFLVNGADRPGAVAEALGKLAAAGIATHAAQAICAGEGRYGALIQVGDDDVKAAKKALTKKK
jgi:hypothetical protein